MAHLSRRSFIGAGLVLITASAVPWAVAPSRSRVFSSREFSDAVGICTHPSWRNRLWGSVDWGSALLETGVKNTRGKIGAGAVGHAAVADLQNLFREGVKICATIADENLDRRIAKANIDFLASEVGARNLSGIESANEFNKPSSRPADWAAQLRDFQDWLHETVRSTPELAGVPVIGPSIWGRLTEDYIALGSLEHDLDRGNLHYYTGGRRPTLAGRPRRSDEGGGRGEYSMADAIREAQVVAPGKPMWITEYGYPVAGPRLRLSETFITETAAAKYLIRGLFDAFGEGVEKIFIYSLIDDVHRSPPRYHGLMDGALRRRPAFDAVKNLMTLFGDRGAASTSRVLDFSLRPLPDQIKYQLFQADDHTFLLTIYQDVDSYDRMTKQDIEVAPVSVGLTLAQRATKMEVFAPTMDLRVRQTATDANDLTIPVSDHVSVVRITL